MQSLASLLIVGLLGSSCAAYTCPKSSALIHASCKVTATVSGSCADVKAEAVARVNGQLDGSWHDPHNNGTYHVLDASDPAALELSRLTGNKKYTDKLTLTFASDSSGGCTVSGCSESQVTSVLDYSTNYCNLRMLYCGSKDGCKPVSHDFAVSETDVDPSTGAGKDATACLKV